MSKRTAREHQAHFWCSVRPEGLLPRVSMIRLLLWHARHSPRSTHQNHPSPIHHINFPSVLLREPESQHPSNPHYCSQRTSKRLEIRQHYETNERYYISCSISRCRHAQEEAGGADQDLESTPLSFSLLAWQSWLASADRVMLGR